MVVLVGSLGYLTLWPDDESQPTVSTLNAIDGAITSNMAALRDRDLPGTVNRVGRSDTPIRDYVPLCPRVCFLEEGHLNRWRFGAMLARIALLPLRTGSQAGGQSNAQEANRVYNNRRFRGEKGNPRLYDPGSGCDFGIYWFA